MSDKRWRELLEADRRIRRLFEAGPENCPGPGPYVLATIEVIGGFELFNTRPYHNYETWSKGYRIRANGITVSAEDLDDALALWAKKAKEKEQ